MAIYIYIYIYISYVFGFYSVLLHVSAVQISHQPSAISHHQVTYLMMVDDCCGKLKHVAVSNINHIHKIYIAVFIGK